MESRKPRFSLPRSLLRTQRATIRPTSQLLVPTVTAPKEMKKPTHGVSTRICIKPWVFFVMFLIFMITFTVTILASLNQNTVSLTQHLRDKFSANGMLREVHDQPSFWRYIRQGLRRALFPENVDAQLARDLLSSSGGAALIPIDADNWMFGSPRLRQQRVTASQGCEGGSMFSLWTITCLGPFSGSNMQKEPYGVKLLDVTGQSITIDDVIKLGRGEEDVQSATTEVPTDEEIQRNAIDARYIWFEYDDATTDSNGVSTSLPNHKGKFATYPPGGYMVQLPTDPDDYDRRTELLQIANFVDLSTRAVFLEMGVWNNNLGLFGVVLVTIEFSPSGLVSSEVHVTTLQPRIFLTPEGLGSIGEWMTTFGEVIVVMFMLYYVAEAASELAKARWKYFKNPWNTIDWIVLVFLITAFAIRLKIYSATPATRITYTTGSATTSNLDVGTNNFAPPAIQLGVLELQDSNVYTDLQQIALDNRLTEQMYALTALSIFLKLFKFIAPLPYIKLLLKSLRGGCRQWGAFIVLFVTTFVAFVTAFNVAFGASINELSTFGKTFLFLSRGFLRDADLNLIYAERTVVGTVAVLFYIVVVYFFLANLMFAIILAGLSDEVSNGRGIEEGENDVMSFVAQLKKWFMVKLKVKRRLARYAPSIYAKIFYKAYNGKDASAARSGTGEPLEVSIGMTDGMQDSTEFDMDQAVADLRRASMSTDRRSLALMISRRLIKSSEEIMPSIEHMAGKALFKIQTMGIDVSSGMHECLQMVDDLQRAANDVYERVEELREQQLEAIGEE